MDKVDKVDRVPGGSGGGVKPYGTDPGQPKEALPDPVPILQVLN